MNWAYLLQCRDGSYYAGWTNDLDKRLAAHNEGKGAKYTRGRGPVRLVWAQSFETQSEAMREEIRLKGLPRAGKELLASQWRRDAEPGDSGLPNGPKRPAPNGSETAGGHIPEPTPKPNRK